MKFTLIDGNGNLDHVNGRRGNKAESTYTTVNRSKVQEDVATLLCTDMVCMANERLVVERSLL